MSNKRLIREDAINILIEHGVSPFNAARIIDAYTAKGHLNDRNTMVALMFQDEPEIVDVGTYEVIEPTPIRTPRRSGHLKLVS